MLPKIVTLFLSLLLISTIHANAIAAKNPAIQIIAENDYRLTLELTLPPFEIETRQGESCQSIVMPNWAKTLEPGYPELPMTSVLIQVPPNGEITTQVIEMQDELLQNIDLCPVSYPLSVIRYQLKNDEAYQGDAFFPSALHKLENRGLLRGVPVSRLRIFPFQWHPATQALRYVTQIVFQVEFENPSPPTLRKRAVQKPDVG
ncbi:MAG: C25 family peptidase propeptide domain-containing protein, partial [Candidatus Parabeggiatoa sp.]|nr:C25 family peptidase propeptide domain-containing protein [Candidatus Parabeggiatoa sp.]